MLLKKTVRYASAFACLYASAPAAMMSGVTPGTFSKAVAPTAKAAMKDGMELAGKPAESKAGGTWLAIVLARRLERITE